MTSAITWEDRLRLIREMDEAPTPPTLEPDEQFDADVSDAPTLVPEGEEP